MRKVKVLAFVLAALMVVAAFAGCGTKDIKADVTTLDERVTALEALLKQVNDTVNGGATKDDITEILDAITANKAEAAAGDKTLADAIAKITADQATANAALKADLEKLVDAAKKDQAAGDTALQVAIEKLNNSIDATNKALADAIKDLEGDLAAGDKATLDAVKELLDDQNKDIADALEDLKESIEKNKEDAGVNASVQAKISAYVSNLTTAKTTYDFEEYHYTASDFAAIEKALSDGIASIQAATTVEAVDAAYAAVVAELAKYERVDVALYNAYKAIMGKINLDSKDAIKAYGVQVEAAREHYENDEDVLEKYEYAAGKEVKLITAATKFTQAYNFLTNDLIYRIYAVDNMIANIGRVQFLKLDKDDDDDDIASNVDAVVAAKAYFEGNPNDTTKYTYKYGVKTIINDTNTSRTDDRQWGQYLDNALVNLVTNKDKLTAHVNTLNALTKAQALLSTYASYNNAGGYNNVFGDYLGVAEAKRNWFEYESKFNAVNSRINAWLADNPVVDAENAEAMLDAYLGGAGKYAEYLEDEAEMKLFLAKYNEFKAEFVNRIKAVNKFSEISTENVKTYAELVKDIKAWLVVIPDDDDDDKDPELVINDAKVVTDTTAADGTQYERMLQKAFGKDSYKDTFSFEDADVKAFFTTVVAQAETVADYINKKIETYASSTTELSLDKFKELEGYKPEKDENGKPTGVYSIPASAADTEVSDLISNTGVVTATVTIAEFKGAFSVADVMLSYDLSYLLDLDALAAAEKAVEERIAAVKVLTDKIIANLDGIKVALVEETEAKDKVSDYVTPAQIEGLLKTATLQNESAVKTLKSDYTNLVASGFKHESTKLWSPYTIQGVVQPGRYVSQPILGQELIYQVTGVINVIDDLRSFSNALVNFVKQIGVGNKYYAFSFDNILSKPVLLKETKGEQWDAAKNMFVANYKWDYLHVDGAKAKVDGNGVINGFTFATSGTKAVSTTGTQTSSTKPTPEKAYKQVDAVELAFKAYNAFVVANGGYTDAALDTAMVDNGLAALRLTAIKKLTHDLVNGTGKPATWTSAFGDYDTYKTITKNAVKAATSIEAVAEILHSFWELTGKEFTRSGADGFYFAGELVFHKNGSLHYEVEYPAVCPNCAQ